MQNLGQNLQRLVSFVAAVELINARETADIEGKDADLRIFLRNMRKLVLQYLEVTLEVVKTGHAVTDGISRIIVAENGALALALERRLEASHPSGK